MSKTQVHGILDIQEEKILKRKSSCWKNSIIQNLKLKTQLLFMYTVLLIGIQKSRTN